MKENGLLLLRNSGVIAARKFAGLHNQETFIPVFFFGDSFIVGNIRNESLLNLWAKSKNMVKLVGNEICNNCSNFKKCRGGCRARALLSDYKDINAIDPLCLLRKNKSKNSLNLQNLL